MSCICSSRYASVILTKIFNFQGEDEIPSQDTLNWADGFLVVYSIIDRPSFTHARRLASAISETDAALVIVANKSDMVHLRQVSPEDGATLARDFECDFFELTAAEQVGSVAIAFQDLCRAVLASRRKSKHSLLERMLGAKTNARLYARGKSDGALPKD